MPEKEPKVSATVEFEADGKQFGYLSVPHSRNESGWGAVHLPVISVKRGDGPTVVFTGGNHGDAYEGPIALMKLARGHAPDEIITALRGAADEISRRLPSGLQRPESAEDRGFTMERAGR